MTVRDYDPADKADIEKLHSLMGMDYKFPDIDQPLFLVKKTCVNDKGEVVGTAFLRLQAEAYLIVSQDLDSEEKMDVISQLSPALDEAAYSQGLDDIVAYIPQEIELKFSKRLYRLGYAKIRQGWNCWVKELF